MLCLVNQVLIERVEFISLKQEASKEIVSAQEFSDWPEIYSSMTSRLDKAELDNIIKQWNELNILLRLLEKPQQD